MAWAKDDAGDKKSDHREPYGPPEPPASPPPPSNNASDSLEQSIDVIRAKYKLPLFGSSSRPTPRWSLLPEQDKTPSAFPSSAGELSIGAEGTLPILGPAGPPIGPSGLIKFGLKFRKPGESVKFTFCAGGGVGAGLGGSISAGFTGSVGDGGPCSVEVSGSWGALSGGANYDLTKKGLQVGGSVNLLDGDSVNLLEKDLGGSLDLTGGGGQFETNFSKEFGGGASASIRIVCCGEWTIWHK